MIEINFLSGQTRQKQKQKEQDQKLFKIAGIVLGVVVFILIAVMGLQLFINFKIKNKTKEIADLKKTIVDQEEVELSYLIYVNKLKAVREIYAARSDKQAAMNYFTELMTDIATITGMTYDEESGGLMLTLDHQNVFFLEKSMDILDTPSVKETYKNVEKKYLSRENQGNYSLSLIIQLKTVEDLGLLENEPANDEFVDDEIIDGDVEAEPEEVIEEIN